MTRLQDTCAVGFKSKPSSRDGCPQITEERRINRVFASWDTTEVFWIISTETGEFLVLSPAT